MGQPALTGFFPQCLSYLLTSNLHIRREFLHCQPSFIFAESRTSHFIAFILISLR
jgi:hypothetical protein